MAGLMASFERVTIQDYEYLIFVVFWNELETPFTKQLREQAISLGAAIEERGFVVQAFEKATYQTADQVLSKNWPEGLRQELENEQDPFMLIINRSFKDFNPLEHPWAIIRISEHKAHPDQVYKIFSRIVRVIRTEGNLFDRFHENKRKAWYQKWAKFIEIKPKVFGVSIDAKGIIEEAIGL